MPLTELMEKQARAQDKPYTMADGNGLILEVRPSGAKYWIVRYWARGKERRKSLGPYPAVTLKMARDQNIDFRRSLEKGSLPRNERFQDIALEWYEKRMKPTMTPFSSNVTVSVVSGIVVGPPASVLAPS